MDFDRPGPGGLNEPKETPGNEYLDLLPEYCVYKDEGCDLAESCLECPFPRCLDEQPQGRSKWTRKYRNREIVRLYLKKNKSARELADIFKVSRQTVYNVLKTRQEQVK